MADTTTATVPVTPKKEGLSKAFIWSHATSVNGGAMAIAATISSYFTIYAQEQVGVTAAQLAVIMLICNIWDAINDPMMGMICDTTHPKWGQYRTWFTFTPVFLLVDMFLLFSNPTFIQGSSTAKFLWVLFTYMFYGMIVTAYTMPQSAILPAMTLNDDERNDVLAKGAGVCALMFTIASTFSTQLVQIFHGYRNLMCTYAVFAIISFWTLFKTSKEKYVKPYDPEIAGVKALKFIFRHKEVYPVMLVWVAASVSYGFMFTSSVYYAQYIWVRKLVNPAEMDPAKIGGAIGKIISTYMGFISVGALISMMFMMPLFLRKFKSGYKALIVSQVMTVILYVILFITGQLNFWWCCIVSYLATVVGAQVNALVNVLVNDTIDFIAMKEGKQLNGLISAVKGFAQKCGTTLVSSGLLALLALTGFDAQKFGPFGQPESALVMTNVVRFLIPALVSVLIVVICAFYPLKKYLPAIAEFKTRMAAEHAAKAAAEEQAQQ